MRRLLGDHTRRRADWAFALGSALVALGVLSHVPMLYMARSMHYRLAGMPMSPEMLIGMALIVGGVALAAYGLAPGALSIHREAREAKFHPPEDAPLSLAHWTTLAAIVAALAIDTMKPASLGLVVPGMLEEYGLSKSTVALLPASALAGTVVGSFVWGLLADIYGRRASILLAAVIFVGASICGAMPAYGWNVFMCFMMGAAAGGLLPVAYALMSEIMPTKHRAWALVLVGGLGMAGGYLAATGLSAWLQPLFSWRVMWLLNLPTGLLLVALNRLIPESPGFLLAIGRRDLAVLEMRRFGGSEQAREAPRPAPPRAPGAAQRLTLLGDQRAWAVTAALTIAAFAWGLINFGVLLWLPADLAAKGLAAGAIGRLLALSALIAAPSVLVAAAAYSLWSSKWTLVSVVGLTALGLWVLMQAEDGGLHESHLIVLGLSLVIIGSNGLLSVLLPYSAESYRLGVRGRATGWISGCSKFGGLFCQGLAIAGAVPAAGAVATLAVPPLIVGGALVWAFCAETRGRDLRFLELAAPGELAED